MEDMRDEYDFSNAEVGKYAERIRKYGYTTPVTRGELPPSDQLKPIALDPDLVKDFPDSAAVNAALREYRKLRDERQTG